MQDHIDKYWQLRLENCKKSLEINNFEVFIASDCNDARRIVIEEILAELDVKSVSWGDSLTFHSTNILEVFKKNQAIEVLETFAPNISHKETIERRRQALLVDLFFTGSNAVTETGKLVNLDMIGNRVAAITFGPINVILFIGRNKIVADVETAMNRIKSYSAPANAIRHSGLKTPCSKTSYCADCKSSDRICNTWAITEKSFPKKRIKVVLINKELGL